MENRKIQFSLFPELDFGSEKLESCHVKQIDYLVDSLVFFWMPKGKHVSTGHHAMRQCSFLPESIQQVYTHEVGTFNTRLNDDPSRPSQ